MRVPVLAAGRERMTTAGKVYTVSPGRPFLGALARGILDGHFARGAKPDAIGLSQYTLLLPTRRATRTLGAAFLSAAGGRALLLPKMVLRACKVPASRLPPPPWPGCPMPGLAPLPPAPP